MTSHSSCAVSDCKNNGRRNSAVVYHSFPKDKDVQRQWILRCKRKDRIKASTSRVCSAHFLPEDYERDLRNELLGLPLKKKLRFGAVPSQNIPDCHSDSSAAGQQVYPIEEIIIKEEVIWPMEEENDEGEASTEDGHPSSLPFEDILVKTEPIKVEAVESNQDIEDELDSREENSDGVIADMKYYNYSSGSSLGIEEGRCSPDQSLTCIHCGIKYANSSVLVQQVTARQKLYCSRKCRKSFWSFRSLSKHFISNDGKEVFICSYCEMQFSTNEKCLNHLENHGDEKPFVCPKCGKAYSNRTGLRQHLFTHANVKRHRCKYCDKSFLYSASLLIHERTHTRERPFQCQECNKAFSQKVGLVEHMTTHNSNRGHKCSLCGNTYTRKYSLVKHMMFHTGEMCHVCPHCGKSFAARYDLMRHVRTHTGSRPFNCNNCGKGFSKRNFLIKHVKLHSTSEPFNCPKIFNNRSEHAKDFDSS